MDELVDIISLQDTVISQCSKQEAHQTGAFASLRDFGSEKLQSLCPYLKTA